MQIQEPDRSSRWLWLGLGALLLVGGLSVWTVRSVMQSRQAEQQAQSQPPPRQVRVAALGRLEPAGRVIQVAAAETGRLDRLLVQEGDTVAAGEILAYLDTYDVRRAERDYAASQLAEAQTQLQAETALGQAQVREAATRLGQVDQPQTFAIEAQIARANRILAELTTAQIDLSRFDQLRQQGAISQQELDQQQSRVTALEEDLRMAQADQQRLEQSRRSDLQNAQAQVQAAEASLVRSQAQVLVESATRNLALAEARLAQTLVRAPRAGQVLRLLVEPGEAVSTAGNSPILALGDTSQMYVVAEVHETDVGLVEVGQPATITSRNGAFDQVLTGTVDQIGLQIFKNDVLDDDPAANADARVVEVRVRVDQSDVVAKLTNLQVDVAIAIE